MRIRYLSFTGIRKGIQRPKEVRLEWVYHVQTAHPLEFLKRPRRHSCHSRRHWGTVRKEYWGIEQHIREACGCFPLWEMYDHAGCCQWDKLPDFPSNNGNLRSRGQVAALNHERQGVRIYCKWQRGFSSSKNALTHRGLWWLIDPDIPCSEIDEQPGLCLVAKNLTWVATCLLSRLKPVCRCGVPDWMGGFFPLRSDPAALPHGTSIFLQALFKGAFTLLLKWLCTGKKWIIHTFQVLIHTASELRLITGDPKCHCVSQCDYCW